MHSEDSTLGFDRVQNGFWKGPVTPRLLCSLTAEDREGHRSDPRDAGSRVLRSTRVGIGTRTGSRNGRGVRGLSPGGQRLSRVTGGPGVWDFRLRDGPLEGRCGTTSEKKSRGRGSPPWSSRPPQLWTGFGVSLLVVSTLNLGPELDKGVMVKRNVSFVSRP